MIGQTAPRLARRLAWADADLVEGTEALLWPASSEADGDVEELPDRSEACRAVLSWVRPKVLRFEIEPPPRALSELLLVSTLAVGGPAQFVAHKSYQIRTAQGSVPSPRSGPRDDRVGFWHLGPLLGGLFGGRDQDLPAQPDRGGRRGRGQGRAQRR
jgi:hypothetical protein